MEDKTVDLLELINQVYQKRRVLVIIVIGFVLLGLLMSFVMPKRYKSKVSFLPSHNSYNGSINQFQGIASFIGVDLPSSSNSTEVSVFVYKDIVRSFSFRQSLLESTVKYNSQEMSYFQYYTDHYRPSLFERTKKKLNPKNWFVGGATSTTKARSDATSFHVNDQSLEMLQMMYESIKLEVIKDSGLVIMEISAPEPEISANLVHNALGLLKKEISAIKTDRLRQELHSLQLNLDEKRKNFDSAQDILARFRDSNQNLSTTLARTQEEKFKNEYDFMFKMYTQASEHYEFVKWQLLKESPNFSIIDGVVVPGYPSTPGKKMTMIIYGTIGAILSITFMFFAYLRQLYFGKTE